MIIHSDCILAMAEMEPSSIDAIITDPPYGLEFMGKEWDKFGYKAPEVVDVDIPGTGFSKLPTTLKTNRRCDVCGHYEYSGTPCKCKNPAWRIDTRVASEYQAWVTQWASEALRVLKPGGSLLSFGGTRTFHRLTCGLEDAGFIIKDCLMYLYGQGFPKAQDLGKMIDKRLGVAREVVGSNPNSVGRTLNHAGGNYGNSQVSDREAIDVLTAPASDLARHWDGYKIGGIKPSFEPIIWAVKKPEGAWIDNVLTFGVGAVNVDECRIAYEDTPNPATNPKYRIEAGYKTDHPNSKIFGKPWEPGVDKLTKGRFPANLLLDEEAARLLDEQSGALTSGERKGTSSCHSWGGTFQRGGPSEASSGGASRFFYTSKATDRQDYNDHPTLKPTDLIEWLIRLVTRPGQLVLDCFAGSGTTGVAAIQSGREFVLIEQDEHYISICERRTSEGVQTGMF